MEEMSAATMKVQLKQEPPATMKVQLPAPMFKVQLNQGAPLKNALEAIGDMYNEANFNISDKGLEVRAMNSSRHTLVVLLLPPESFDHYSCKRNLSVGLNVAYMAKVFRCVSNDCSITITTLDEWCDPIVFKFVTPKKNKMWRFHFDTVAISGKLLEMPEEGYQTIVRMPSAEFMGICEQLSSIGERDTVGISVDKDSIEFFSCGDFGRANIFCMQTETVDKPEEATLIQTKKPISQEFDLKYINSFTKASTLSDQVTISLSYELPVMVHYEIAEMGSIRYYMAPLMQKKKDEMLNKEDEMLNKEDEMLNKEDEMQT